MAESYSKTALAATNAFTLNEQGDDQPWGTRENTLFKSIIDACYEIYNSGAHPIFTLTAAHASTYDPQVRFKVGAEPATVKASFGWDAGNARMALDIGAGGIGDSVDFTWNGTGFGVGVEATAGLDVVGDSIRIRTAQTPATAGATGLAGEIAWDTGFLYVCTANNARERVAVASW